MRMKLDGHELSARMLAKPKRRGDRRGGMVAMAGKPE